LIYFCTFFIVFYSSSARAQTEEQAFIIYGEKIYLHYCAPCHGAQGDGKGFNARNLDPRPAKHNDAVLMDKRRDKDLFDAISLGGRGIGKSTLMPPWGDSLKKSQINSLVQFLRKLCNCNGQ
jgi:mono/diheme cytochrome c family protein